MAAGRSQGSGRSLFGPGPGLGLDLGLEPGTVVAVEHRFRCYSIQQQNLCFSLVGGLKDAEGC